jgi:hypothetical protein
MLAREFVQAFEPAFEFLELRRVDIEVGADPIEQHGSLVELDRRGIEHCVDFGQARFVFLHPCQFAAQLLQLVRQGRRLVAKTGEGAVAGGDQAGCVGMAAVRSIEFGDRGRIEDLTVEFVELVREPVVALGDVARPAVARAGECFAFAQQSVPVLRSVADLRQQHIVPAAGI